MGDVEIRELRYFTAVAQDLHFRHAAQRLGISQPALSRAIQQLERRLGFELFRREAGGVRLTRAGEVLLDGAPDAMDAVSAAVARARRTADADDRVVLVSKAGASHDVLRALLAAHAARPGAQPVEVLLCEVGEQRRVLHEGRADAALMHHPYDVFDDFQTLDLLVEGQVAVVPRGHPIAQRRHLTMAEAAEVPGLPMARWPQHDGSYAPGPGPEVRTQPEIAQLVSLGRALLVIPESSRAWQWPDHVAVPVHDAPLVTTRLSWPASTKGSRLDGLLHAAAELSCERVL